MADDQIENSPYCECGACGESGCCPVGKCFHYLISQSNCKYGEGYLKESELAIEFTDWVLGFESKSNAVLPAKLLHRKYRELLEKYFPYPED